ncbi:MAG: putative system TPR-repeat lipoprotein [Armatimonadetes bacterium]|nr:putative system TPR-repeat lipoprotein [Armatimonadota bacterium]
MQNTGIGHDFPTGMPDLQEAWLEVTLSDPSGRRVSGSGVTGPATGSDPGAHTYRLVPLDRSGQPLRHGELDRWASTAEWRRIPAGGADLARYALTAPRGGGTLRFRLLRRRRPDFSRWAGEPVQTAPQILAELTQPLPGPGAVTPGAQSQAARWRAYGNALAGVKNFPQALAALRTASELDPADVETVLAQGRVYLDEGDLLDAREQFRKAQASDAERGQAWEAAVLRRMGQPDQAAVLLKPLVRRYPRDARLRFELASAYMAALRNEDAAREFEAVLDVDPTNDRAHFSLMFCLQRLNRLTAARREETIYRLLRPETVTAAGKAGATEDRPLHVHPLEPAR